MTSKPGGARGEASFELLPAIDLLRGRVVRLREGDFSRATFYGKDPVEFALRWADEGAHRIHLVDLEGAAAGRPVQESTTRDVIRRSAVPCELAGGIRDRATVERVLEWGVERVVMGTALLRAPELAAELVGAFGADRIVAAIDVREGQAVGSGWLPSGEAMDFTRALAGLAQAGIEMFEVTAIARDGLQRGPDLELLRLAADIVGTNRIIASGGVTSVDDVRSIVELGFRGAILGRALYEETLSLADAARAVRVALQGRDATQP